MLFASLVRRLRHSVRDRLLLGGVVVLAPIGLAFGYWGVENQREVLLQTIDRQGRTLVGATAIFCVEPLLTQDYPVLDTYVDSLTRDKESVVYARIEDRRGRIVAEAKVAYADAISTTEYSAAVAVPGGGPTMPAEDVGLVVLGLSTEPAEAALADSRRLQYIETLAAFLALVIGLSWLHLRLVGRPLMALDRDAQRLAQADLSQPIQLNSEDEFGRLARALEEMRVGLRASYREIQEQNESLLELDRLKSQFLATVSHEIRTPMTGVLGFARELLATDLSERQTEMLQLVMESADSLLSILNGILDFSKIDAGRLELELMPFDLRRLLGDVVKLSGPVAKEGRVALSTVGLESLPPAVVGDPHRLRQVVGNLLSNAIKFSADGCVELAVEVMEHRQEHCRLRIKVSDTGIGIPEDKIELLFEPFRQVDGSHSRKYGGSGLGLSICQGLLAMMDSKIVVQSEVGAGSEFRFDIELPIAAADSVTAASLGGEIPIAATLPRFEATRQTQPGSVDPSLAVACKGMTVLLAEDNSINQRLIKTLLIRLGAEVEVADNGRMAVDRYLAAPTRFDLILMDCQMPEVDGLAATEEIRSRHDGAERVPILALTANSEPGMEDRCRAAGMDGFLAKPLLLQDLRTALVDWVGPRS